MQLPINPAAPVTIIRPSFNGDAAASSDGDETSSADGEDASVPPKIFDILFFKPSKKDPSSFWSLPLIKALNYLLVITTFIKNLLLHLLPVFLYHGHLLSNFSLQVLSH